MRVYLSRGQRTSASQFNFLSGKSTPLGEEALMQQSNETVSPQVR